MSNWYGEPGEDYEPEPSLSRLATLHDSGAACCECFAQFTEAHGQKTACEYCWKRLTSEERASVHKATYPELNKETHRLEAKARKARKAK